MVSTLIWSDLVNEASQSTLVQFSKLIITLINHYLTEEKVIKRLIGEIVLDLQPRNIDKKFPLPREDQYVRLTYHQEERWYRDNE